MKVYLAPRIDFQLQSLSLLELMWSSESRGNLLKGNLVLKEA